jgi:hypothetical protein
MSNETDCAINGDANYRIEGKSTKAAIGVNASPPPPTTLDPQLGA